MVFNGFDDHFDWHSSFLPTQQWEIILLYKLLREYLKYLKYTYILNNFLLLYFYIYAQVHLLWLEVIIHSDLMLITGVANFFLPLQSLRIVENTLWRWKWKKKETWRKTQETDLYLYLANNVVFLYLSWKDPYHPGCTSDTSFPTSNF